MNAITKKIGCTTQIFVGLRNKKGLSNVLVVRSKLLTASEHNHAVNAELFGVHPEIRKMTDESLHRATDLYDLGTGSGVILPEINSKRRAEGKISVPTAKNISYKVARAHAIERAGLKRRSPIQTSGGYLQISLRYRLQIFYRRRGKT